jgi:hypothetical protein
VAHAFDSLVDLGAMASDANYSEERSIKSEYSGLSRACTRLKIYLKIQCLLSHLNSLSYAGFGLFVSKQVSKYCRTET